MGDCGCNKKAGTTTQPAREVTAPIGAPQQASPIAHPKRIDGIVTKQKCPKCSYWMSLIITPSTKEKTFKCQNTLCKHSMPYSQHSRLPLV